MGLHEALGALKPSRSEEGQVLSEEEHAKYSQQVREFLAATTPVRPLKPSRSDLEDNTALLDGLVAPEDYCKAELARFKALEADGEVLHTDGGTVNDDSYVETPYYDDLNAVDKTLHHKTGSGFIVSEDSALSFTLGDGAEKVFRTTNKTNPACNEWQPSPPQDVHNVSKVYRSESSET